MTDATAKDIAAALWSIASKLEDISDALTGIEERIDEITPEEYGGLRHLRTLDIGRD